MNEREKVGRSSVGGKQLYEAGFDYTLPRPRPQGEERSYNVTKRGLQQHLMDPPRHLQNKSSSPVPKFELEEGYRHEKPPACVTWAQSLHNLLQDPDGVKLFLSYLESEGPDHAVTLHFWFACEGLKNLDHVEKIQRLVKLIYKTYFMKSALPINDDLRKQIVKNMKLPQCLDPPITLFDEAQAQIEYLINKTTYPNFLKSDIYLDYLQSAENANCGEFDGDVSPASPTPTTKDLGNLAGATVGPLPTLHEGMEFNTNQSQGQLVTPGSASVSTGHHTPTVRLTEDMLLRSQKYRVLGIRPKSETYAGFIYRSNGAHAAYNSYNPVSRQDSEMQSLSSHSDARTESDNTSLKECSMDGRNSGRGSRPKCREDNKMFQLAAKNKETNMNQTFIPRTQQYLNLADRLMPLDEHAALLTKKLEDLKRQQESEEWFQKHLKESDSMSSLEDKLGAQLQTRELETAMREKLQFQDDSDQDILDEHVSRVFSDHSSISPGLSSPKPSSPPRTTHYVQPPRRRRDQDGFSTFSGDSGNVHDFPDMPKSKSIPEYGDERFTRMCASRRSNTQTKRTTPTELTDSGVSVLSDVVPVGKGNRVVTWLRESDRSARATTNYSHSEMAVGKKFPRRHSSRSNSLERTSVPAQPFVADPNMPPPPFPNTDIQLEEIRRRLLHEDDVLKNKTRQKSSTNKYYHPDLALSSQSTLRKSMKRGETKVVYSFGNDIPYSSKIPGTRITLREFKNHLPKAKKESYYRYFFKTVCEDLGYQATLEEVTNDNEVLPLWEGKIVAEIQQID